MNFDIIFFFQIFKISGIFVPMPFYELVQIWNLCLSICIDSNDLQSNFEVSFVHFWFPYFPLIVHCADYVALSVYLITVPVVVGVSSKSGHEKLKTCSIYHENILLQNFNDIIKQVLQDFFFSI